MSTASLRTLQCNWGVKRYYPRRIQAAGVDYKIDICIKYIYVK